MTQAEGSPQPGTGPEDVRRQQVEIAERLAVLVSDFGLDSELAAGYAHDTRGLYGYSGVDTAFSGRLDELKATTVEQLLGLCEEAYGQGFDDPVVRRQVRRLQHRLGAHGSAGDPRFTAELAK